MKATTPAKPPKKHRCPPWCHRCPLMGGNVMPGCMGSATGDLSDLSRCYCNRPEQQLRRRRKLRFLKRVMLLEAKVEALEDEMAALRRET